MTTIRLKMPQLRGNAVHFEWSVDPETTLYKRTNFKLEFPDAVDVRAVPQSVWLRVMMICLHSQWGMLRPCRVVVPGGLPDGEAEFWMRLIDAEIWALEVDRQEAGLPSFTARTARTVEVVGSGALLEPMPKAPDNRIVATAFSGGRDSLTQLALLQELGETPLLVTVTSAREGSEEFKTARRRAVIDEITTRRGVELAEIHSDLRSCWNNTDPLAGRYRVAVSETADTMLYFAAAWATAFARGATGVFLASEAEVQESIRRDGMIVQHNHFMYSAVTQLAMRALIAPTGIGYSGLTYPLRQFQIQRLLGTRFTDIRDLQYSCWSQRPGEDVCSRCRECFSIGVNMMSNGIAPSEIGIDLNELLPAMRDWVPGGNPDRPRSAVGSLAGSHGDGQMLRFLRSTDEEPASALAPDNGYSPEAVDAFKQIRASALAAPAPLAEPGYRGAYIDLIDERLREPYEKILREHFEPEPIEMHRATFERTRVLGGWIGAPLTAPPTRRPSTQSGERPERAEPPVPSEPRASQLAAIAQSIPGPEPMLQQDPTRRTLPVADTALDGNELAYIAEAVESNWVSSVGPYVEDFEARFAEFCGTRFAVTTASGSTALELMLRAVGIGPGDEVIVPSFTMIATANAVHHTGAKVVFVDTDLATWNLDLDRVVEAIGPKTRAIMAMHTYGHPVDMDALRRIGEDNSLVILEDAAEAHGAKVRGKRAGSISDAAAFSFYGNKIMTTGEGGVVTTNNPQIADAARLLRGHAFSEDRHFWHRYRAFNYRMSNLQAAIGLAQLERIDEFLELRRNLARLYREYLGPIKGITVAPVDPELDDANWMFGILVDDDFACSRDDLRAKLAADAIETRSFFVPLHLQPAYIDEFEGRRHPGAETLGRTGLYLPSALWLTEEDVARIATVIDLAASGAGSAASAART